MKRLDRFIRDRRIAQAIRRIPLGARVLDVGCHDGHLFRALGPALRAGVGIDADLVGPLAGDRYRLLPGRFPEDLPPDLREFDVITFLAVLEHIPSEQHASVVDACWNHLVPGGTVVITVPSPQVDHILDALERLRLVDGIRHEQHFGLRPDDLVPIFAAGGFALTATVRFQLGLNNLFVLTKQRAKPAQDPPRSPA